MALAVEKATRQQLISSTATDEAVVTVTEIGTKLGISAIKTNKLLIEKGLQTKNPNKKSKKDPDYLPTGKGLEFAQITTAVGKDRNDTYQQLRWYPSVINQL